MFLDFIPSFNAGELSPLMDARVGLEKYQAGCRVLKNFIPVPYGGVGKRSGFMCVAEVQDSTKKTRLHAFRFSTTTQFILEFGHMTLRFIGSGQVVTETLTQYTPFFNGGPSYQIEAPYVVSTPYDEDDVFDLKFQQINDVVWITHPNYAPHMLTRRANNDWTLVPVAWDWPPLRDENVDGTKRVTPSAVAGAITVTSTANIFSAAMVGSIFAIGWSNTGRASEIQVNSTTVATYDSPPLTVFGRWNAYSFNYADGTFEIQRSYDSFATWEVIRTFRVVQGDRNFNTSGEEARECKLRIHFVGKRFDYGATSPYNVHAVIEVIDHREWGLVTITGYNAPNSVNATTVGSLPYATQSHIWAEAAFSDKNGYPRTVGLHAGRLWYGGTRAEPMRLWASVVDDFSNFRRSSLADGSIAATITASQTDNIQWLNSQANALLVGTQGKEYVVQGSGDSPIGPGNITSRSESAYGSAYLPALLVNYVSLFVQRSRLSVREFVFALERDGYVGANMTRLASHITSPGIKQWDFQQSFDAIVWAITSDGRLIGLTYERDENVVGWHRHETQGQFESVAVLYGQEGKADEVYAVIKRTINGEDVRFIELMSPDAFEHQRDDEGEQCVFLDCSKKVTGDQLTEIADLDHLEGMTVDVLADGAKRATAVVEDGVIQLDNPADVVVVGLSYEAVLKPMKIEVPQRNGTSQTRTFKLTRLAARVWQTLGGQMRAADNEPWQTLAWRDTANPMGQAPPLFTGEKEIALDAESGPSLEFSIRSNDPHPFTVLALAPKFDVHGE